MKLGGSLRRTRPSGKRRGGKRRTSRGALSRGRAGTILRAAGLVVLGWVGGYLVATRVIYPAPPPPTDLVVVPDVRGADVRAASERLATAGLELGPVDSLRHPSVAADRVVGQSPLPGQLAFPGSAVVVTRSAGPQTRPVPDVVNVDASRALVILESSGFVVQADSVDSDVPRGRVTMSEPTAGTVVAIPAQVRIAVSRGPALIPMPFLLGLEEVRALTLLDSVGLVLGSVEDVMRPGRDEGIVIGQDPPPDTLVERGSAVRLAVGRRGR